MTNKKKTATRKSAKGTNKDDKKQQNMAALKDAANTLRRPSSSIGAFSTAQLGIIIIMSLGVSRLLQIGGAVTKEGTTDTAACQEYMIGEEACADPAVAALIRYKYFTGIQTTLLVMIVLIQYWQVEEHLARFTALLIALPIGLSVAAHNASAEWIPAAKIWRHMTMCIVLTAVAAPAVLSRQAIPFFSGHKQPFKTLQSLAVMTLATASVWEAFQLLQPVFWDEDVPSLLTVPVSSSAYTALLYFLAVDKVTNASVYAFSWYYMEDNLQRVSSKYLLHASVQCSAVCTAKHNTMRRSILLILLYTHSLTITSLSSIAGLDSSSRFVLLL
jgi:hypothetical protein